MENSHGDSLNSNSLSHPSVLRRTFFCYFPRRISKQVSEEILSNSLHKSNYIVSNISPSEYHYFTHSRAQETTKFSMICLCLCLFLSPWFFHYFWHKKEYYKIFLSSYLLLKDICTSFLFLFSNLPFTLHALHTAYCLNLQKPLLSKTSISFFPSSHFIPHEILTASILSSDFLFLCHLNMYTLKSILSVLQISYMLST